MTAPVGRSGNVCPRCGRERVVEHPRGAFAHCFGCGHNQFAVPPEGVAKALVEIAAETHDYLLANDDVRRYLTEKVNLHRQVLIDSAIGLVPPDFDPSQRLLPAVQDAQEKLRELEEQRPKGRPSITYLRALGAAQWQVEHATKAHKDVVAFVETRQNWLLFFYSDAHHQL